MQGTPYWILYVLHGGKIDHVQKSDELDLNNFVIRANIVFMHFRACWNLFSQDSTEFQNSVFFVAIIVVYVSNNSKIDWLLELYAISKLTTNLCNNTD